MTKIAIILGSIRDGRVSPQIGEWVKELGEKRGDAEYSIIDMKDYDIPLMVKRFSEYSQDEPEYESLKKLSESIKNADGYIFITPEYNHGMVGSLKNMLDLFYVEWNNKAAGIVSHGSSNGARAAEQLRNVLAELQVATVRHHIGLSIFHDFEGFVNFKPLPVNVEGIEIELDQLIAWTNALKPLRI